jgi:hypothetical protein
MVSVLLIGFMIGLQHALEADHLAAVSAIASTEKSLWRVIRHGSFWGVGHTLTLMIFAGSAIAFDLAIGSQLALWLEFAVGIMLIGLGNHVLYRLFYDRIHFHVHRHHDDALHLHAHGHAGESRRHDPEAHTHPHPKWLSVRTLIVGMVHGMAGSAALLILTTSSMVSPAVEVVYVVLFGLGSIVGMTILSVVIAAPLAATARWLSIGNWLLRGGVGMTTAGLGLAVVLDTTPELLRFF